MKKALTLTALLLFFTTAFTTCQKIEKDAPQAIKKLIRKSEHTGRVVEYEYNNGYIYSFLPRTDHFDCPTIYYNEKGNKLWEVELCWGGWGTPIEGFYEKSVLKRIIWTHKTWKD
jgi:hypothetical protein